MNHSAISDDLSKDVNLLRFGPPVTHVYNPLDYAREPYDKYMRLYAKRPKEIVLLGMNPGPWGMAQTGVPFGEVGLIRDWLGIEAPVGTPPSLHPKKPVQGFACTRSEVSGKRLWGWAKKTFQTPERFFDRFIVINYCPLLFIEETGRNRTPDHLRAAERKALFQACDRALRRTIQWIKPRYVVGVGKFSEERAREALSALDVTIGRITHPSPANPRANRGWEPLVVKELKRLGIRL
jgi:single-strand selective monofunctional uracil DNA glycosylase